MEEKEVQEEKTDQKTVKTLKTSSTPNLTQTSIYKKLPLTTTGDLIVTPNTITGPENLIITSFPKSGKTLSILDVPGLLVGNTEKTNRDFGNTTNVVNLRTLDEVDENGQKKPEFIKLKSNGAYIPRGIFETVDELRVANNMNEYWKLQNQIDLTNDKTEKERLLKEQENLVQKMPFPIFCIDTITSIQELNEKAALAAYNAEVKIENRKKDIKKVDNYSGVRFTRRNFDFLKSFIERNAAPYIIWMGHVGARKKILEKGEQEISVADIALDGLQSTLFTTQSTANAILYRDDDGVWLDFRKKEETDFGSRTPFLSNKVIKIADIISEEDLIQGKRPKTYWDTIYPELSNILNKNKNKKQ